MYLWAPGWDQPLESLLPIDPQPATVGLQYNRRQFAASGIVIDEGPFWELLFSALEDGNMYKGLLTQSGLLVAKTAPMSVYGPDENYDPILRNVTMVKPLIGSDGARKAMWHSDFVFLAKNLVAQA